MQYTIEKLIEGDSQILLWYQEAKKMWDQILGIYALTNENDLEKLPGAIKANQKAFERDCGGRIVGLEVMVLSGFGVVLLERTGKENDLLAAQNLYNAFIKSDCYPEVHKYAKKFAKALDLLD